MFCRKCGAELRIKAGAKFCGKCGTPIAAPKTSAPEKEPKSKPKSTIWTPEPKPEPKPASKKSAEPEKKPTLIRSMPKPGSSGTSSNGEKDNWFSDAGDL